MAFRGKYGSGTGNGNVGSGSRGAELVPRHDHGDVVFQSAARTGHDATLLARPGF